jgi:hypothetical protein
MPPKNLTVLKPTVAGTLGPVFIVCRQSHFMPYHLSLEDFKETGDETFAWESFEKKLSAYSFLKYLVQENDIHVDLPGLKTFLSFSETDTEKSEFCSIEVLDEKADSKATVLKTLNILHKKFQIGIKLQYQVVVGTGNLMTI